jgi:uncharacterized protein (TIGR00297 family)
MLFLEILTGLLSSALVAFPAYLKKALTPDGLLAALILGTSLFIFGSWPFYAVMISFFVSSSVISKMFRKQHKEIENITAKGSRRDYTQVIANGGVGLLFAFLYFLKPLDLFYIGFAAAFAAANADTWASEIGTLSSKAPVYIIKRLPVAKGMSGGVSALGFLASLGGAFFIGFIAILGLYMNRQLEPVGIFYLLVIVSGGFLGSVIDSLIGEMFQAKYVKNDGVTLTERRFENSRENRLVSGYDWINNNVVNFLSVLLASLASCLVLFL